MMILNGNGQQIQVCSLLILNTKNIHVARDLTQKIEISPKNMCKLTQKTGGGGGGGWQL